MKHLYLIRHGHSDYEQDSLTSLGKKQIAKLGDQLGLSLQRDASYGIFSSPAGRAFGTAYEITSRFFDDWPRRIVCDPVLQERKRLWGKTPVMAVGRAVGSWVNDMSARSDVSIIFSHNQTIAAATLAFAEQYGISLPEYLAPTQIDESAIQEMMRKHKTSREAVMKDIEDNNSIEVQFYPKKIPLASAVHFNLEGKIVELIDPNSS
jgi:phosphohistidine phosphatase SixA